MPTRAAIIAAWYSNSRAAPAPRTGASADHRQASANAPKPRAAAGTRAGGRGRDVAEGGRRQRRHERPEPERDERGRAEAGGDPLRDPADEPDAGEERDPARQEPDSPDAQRLIGPARLGAEPERLGGGKLEDRHARGLVRVEVAAVARAVERSRKAGVVPDAAVRQRLRQAEPRAVLLAEAVDRGERGDADEREQEQ